MSVEDSDIATWLEAYRSDSLSPEQRADLLRRLESDVSFQKQFCLALSDATRLDIHFSGTNNQHHQACILDAVNLSRTSRRLREVKLIREARDRGKTRSHSKPRVTNRPQRSRGRRPRQHARHRATGIAMMIVAILIMLGAALVWTQRSTAGTPGMAPTVPGPSDTPAWSIARIHAIAGTATLNERPLATGAPAIPNGRLRIDGYADMSLSDQTRFQITGQSDLEVLPDGPLRLNRGYLSITIAKQPTNHPFHISGPHGDISVIGTQFAMRTTTDETIVALSEGTIETQVNNDRQTWHAPAMIRLKDRASALDSVVVYPGDGTITDPSWTLSSDVEALTGKAWVLTDQRDDLWTNRQASDLALASTRGIELVVPALAGVAYHCWIRTRCDASGHGPTRLRHDTVALQIDDGRIINRPPVSDGRTFPEGDQLASFSGSAASDGYVWIGGYVDGHVAEQDQAVTIVFDQSGLQRLRLITYEGPLRIDAIQFTTDNRPPATP